jgi:hypothetical protein
VEKIETKSRNSVLNHFAEEKTTWNAVLWNKNRSKHLEFCSEPFRGREINSELHSVDKNETSSWNSVRFAIEKTLSILFAGARFFVNKFFLVIPFCSELRN